MINSSRCIPETTLTPWSLKKKPTKNSRKKKETELYLAVLFRKVLRSIQGRWNFPWGAKQIWNWRWKTFKFPHASFLLMPEVTLKKLNVRWNPNRHRKDFWKIRLVAVEIWTFHKSIGNWYIYIYIIFFIRLKTLSHRDAVITRQNDSSVSLWSLHLQWSFNDDLISGTIWYKTASNVWGFSAKGSLRTEDRNPIFHWKALLINLRLPFPFLYIFHLNLGFLYVGFIILPFPVKYIPPLHALTQD